jgi:hypothetical protein
VARVERAAGLHAVDLDPLVELCKRRDALVGCLVGVADVDVEPAAAVFADPEAVGIAQLSAAELQHRFERGQPEDLHAPVVALDHEGKVAAHGDPVRALELPRAGAARPMPGQLAAGRRVVDDDLVGLLGGGQQPRIACRIDPDGHGVDVVPGPDGGDVTLLDDRNREVLSRQRHAATEDESDCGRDGRGVLQLHRSGLQVAPGRAGPPHENPGRVRVARFIFL